MSEAALQTGLPAPALGAAALARLLALVLPAALLAGAFGSQFFGGLVPCEMCWWQRYAHCVAVALAVAAFSGTATSRHGRLFTLLAAAAIAASGAIAVYHAGVEQHIFEGFTQCTSSVSGATAAERLKSIMTTPLVRCDQIQWSFLGISMAGWNAILSLAGAALIAVLTLKARRR